MVYSRPVNRDYFMNSDNEDPTQQGESLFVHLADDIDMTSQERKTSSGSDPSSDKSMHSMGSAGSGSTIFGVTQFNEPVLLVIDPKKEGGQISLFFTPLRSKTALGDKQGDHVISHRLFLEFCATTIAGQRLIDTPKKLKDALEILIPDILSLNDPSLYPELPDNFPDYEEAIIQLLVSNELSIHHYKLGVRHERAEKVAQYLSQLLSYYNSMRDVAYEKTGSKGKSEGRDHSASIIALSAINICLAMGNNPNPDNIENFYKQCIEPHGEFVNGMKKIFGQGVEEIRRDLRRHDNKQAAFYKSFFEKASNPELIGSIMEYFFDFPYLPQRKTEQLIKLSHRCITMTLEAFPMLHTLDEARIRSGFLGTIITKQGWANLQIDPLLDEMKKLELHYAALRI